MRKYSEKFIHEYGVLRQAKIGIEFEFYMKDLSFYKTLEMLNQELSPVRVHGFRHYHSDFVPDDKNFKIEPDLSGGSNMVELVTGPMEYNDAKFFLVKISKFIENYGYTNEKSSIHFNLSFFGDKNLNDLNVLKLILNTNEEEIYSFYPSRKGNIYAKSVKSIIPFKGYDFFNIPIDSIRNSLHLPEDKYYGINFLNINNNKETQRIEYRYIGGKDYTKKKKEAVSAINLVIEHLFTTLSSNYSYTAEEKKKINTIVNEFRTSIDGTRNYFNFKMLYPNISVYIDLKDDPRIVEANYTILREKVFKLIVGGGITEATINYDSRRKAVQVKDAVLKKSILIEGIEFYQCQIEADAHLCLFEGCTIKYSKLQECTIFSNNIIKGSKIINCDYLGGENEISMSYLDNSETKMINAELKECLVNRGKFTINSTIDKSTKIIKK